MRMAIRWLEKQFFKLVTILEMKTRESSTKKVMKMIWGLGRDSALRALVVIAGVWVPAPMWWLTAICNPNPEDYDLLFWHLNAVHTYGAQTYIQTKHPYT